MSFDLRLAERIRECLAETPGIEERKMFGGLAFLVNGRMCCGVLQDDLVLRLGEDGSAAALRQEHVRPMDFTGRVMRSMVYVAPAGTRSKQRLQRWLTAAVRFAATQPKTVLRRRPTASRRRVR